MRNRNGITLVELILTLAIVSLVIPLIYSIFFVGTTSYSVSTNKGFAQQDIRIAADFLTDELRFVTDISEVGFGSSEYYSLSINSEGNLVKSKHVRQEDDTVVETPLNIISGNWGAINISNNVTGVIDIELEQTEQTGSKEAGFELALAISTENSPNILSNVSLELVDGNILYYQNTKITSLSNSIYLYKQDEVGGEFVTVRFYRNDDTINLYRTSTGNSGTMESLPAIPVRGGYTFIEWNTNEDGNGISYGSGGKTTFEFPTNSTDLYAIWTASGELQQVEIDTFSGSDGVIEIDSIKNPIKVGGRFEVDKSIGSKVKIKLKGYTSSHIGKVTVTVNNSTTAIEEGGFVIFNAKADTNGNKKPFDVEITIKTDGQSSVFTKKYEFITSN